MDIEETKVPNSNEDVTLLKTFLSNVKCNVTRFVTPLPDNELRDELLQEYKTQIINYVENLICKVTNSEDELQNVTDKQICLLENLVVDAITAKTSDKKINQLVDYYFAAMELSIDYFHELVSNMKLSNADREFFANPIQHVEQLIDVQLERLDGITKEFLLKGFHLIWPDAPDVKTCLIRLSNMLLGVSHKS